jgi:ribulose bisphosphate carboxylase small subunit
VGWVAAHPRVRVRLEMSKIEKIDGFDYHVRQGMMREVDACIDRYEMHYIRVKPPTDPSPKYNCDSNRDESKSNHLLHDDSNTKYFYLVANGKHRKKPHLSA